LSWQIGLAFTTCGNGSTSDDGGGPAFLGDKLELSGQVYLENYTQTGISYTAFSEGV